MPMFNLLRDLVLYGILTEITDETNDNNGPNKDVVN